MKASFQWFALLSYFLSFFICISSILQLDKEVVIREVDFDPKKDTIAFIHIQKTSGTLWINEMRKSLIALDKNNGWSNVCVWNERRKFFDCLSSRSSFNRLSSVFWNLNENFNCDIHANIGELRKCIHADHRSKGKVNMITMLRNPIERYISEFKHVQKGATWFKSVRYCKEKPLYSRNCYAPHNDWSHATWKDFLACDYNQANNRQVRMLADFFEIGCNSLDCWTKSEKNCSKDMKSSYEAKILENAKKNLRSLSFFGLTEHQSLSQYLFDKTFQKNLKFSENSIGLAEENERLSSKLLEFEFKNYRNEIIARNTLDIALHEYAEKIFFARVSYFQNLNKT